MATVLRIHLGSLTTPVQPSMMLELPAGAARHVQVRRLQPGELVRLFDGRGQEWEARLVHMGRASVQVEVLVAVTPIPELEWQVTLALGVPANERMDSLVEKATELGVARIQPLITERSVLRLSGERAHKRVEHWAAVAAAAAEQCGRATVPVIAPWQNLTGWLDELDHPAKSNSTSPPAETRWLLSPQAELDRQASRHPAPTKTLIALSGPEGGLSPEEEAAAISKSFVPVSLGPRVLRADTAPLAVLAWLSLLA